MFASLVSLFERAYISLYDESMDGHATRMWQSWEDYMSDWCKPRADGARTQCGRWRCAGCWRSWPAATDRAFDPAPIHSSIARTLGRFAEKSSNGDRGSRRRLRHGHRWRAGDVLMWETPRPCTDTPRGRRSKIGRDALTARAEIER